MRNIEAQPERKLVATKPKSKIRRRAAEPSTWAGIGLIASVALPGLLTFLQTGSKTAGVVAILSALAGGAATVMPDPNKPSEPPAEE